MSTAALLGLRIAPVLLATSSLTFSFSEYHFYRPYLDLAPRTSKDVSSSESKSSSDQESNQDASTHQAKVNNLLRSYISRQFPAGFATILTLYPLTWATAIANIKFSSTANGTSYLQLPSISKKLYLAGLVFSVGHMLWGPRAKDLMETIGGLNGDEQKLRSEAKTGEKVGTEEKKDNLYLLRSWLKLHVVRSVLADFPSWACFTAGFYFMLTRRVPL